MSETSRGSSLSPEAAARLTVPDIFGDPEDDEDDDDADSGFGMLDEDADALEAAADEQGSDILPNVAAAAPQAPAQALHYAPLVLEDESEDEDFGDDDDDPDHGDDCHWCNTGRDTKIESVAVVNEMITNNYGKVSNKSLYREAVRTQRSMEEKREAFAISTSKDKAAKDASTAASKTGYKSFGLRTLRMPVSGRTNEDEDSVRETGELDEHDDERMSMRSVSRSVGPAERRRSGNAERREQRRAAQQPYSEKREMRILQRHMKTHCHEPGFILMDHVRIMRKLVRMYESRLIEVNDQGVGRPHAKNIEMIRRLMKDTNDMLKLNPRNLLGARQAAVSDPNGAAVRAAGV